MRINRVIAAATLAVALVGGCTSGADDGDGTTDPSSVPATESPAEPGQPSPSASATLPAVADDLLLPPEAMPVWNGAAVWTVADGEDASAIEAVLQVCPAPDMADFGAEASSSRFYRWDDGDMDGVNIVGRFANRADATAAAGDIAAAFGSCTGGNTMSSLGTASTWTTSAPASGDDSRFEFVGVDRVDEYVTVVGFTLTAQDANYETDPLIDSVLASSDVLRVNG